VHAVDVLQDRVVAEVVVGDVEDSQTGETGEEGDLVVTHVVVAEVELGEVYAFADAFEGYKAVGGEVEHLQGLRYSL